MKMVDDKCKNDVTLEYTGLEERFIGKEILKLMILIR